MSRTCFKCYKLVPGPGPTKTARIGRYYFLPKDAEFLQHSKLGGHWFEGPPFQSGDYSTLKNPKPVWVDGSMNFEPGWSAPTCCTSGLKPFIPSHAELRIIHRGPNFTDTLLSATIGEFQGNVLATFQPHAFGNRYTVALHCHDTNHGIVNECQPGVNQPLTLNFEPLPPPYICTLNSATAVLNRPTGGACYTSCAVRVRFYGTLKPEPPLP